MIYKNVVVVIDDIKVASNLFEEFDDEVNRYLYDGFRLVGSATFSYHGSYSTMLQTLVKDNPDCDNDIPY